MKLLLTPILCIALFSLFLHAEETNPPASSLLKGMNGSFEMVDGDVLKVYSVEDQGAKFTAYVVKYKEKEVIVSDPLNATPEKKEGDKITFMVNHLEMPRGTEKVKIIQFIRVK